MNLKKDQKNTENLLIIPTEVEAVRASIKKGRVSMMKIYSVEEDSRRNEIGFENLIKTQIQAYKVAQLIASKLHNVHRNNSEAISVPGNLLKGEVDNASEIMSYAFFALNDLFHFNSKRDELEEKSGGKSYTREIKAASFLHSWVVKVLKEKKTKTPDKRSKDVCCETSLNIEKAEALLANPSHKLFKNKSYYQKLELFVANYDHEKKCNWVVYSRAEGKATGRRMARGPSFQNLPKDLREYLLNDISDIDMVNCHPKIIRARALKEGIDVAPLDYYLANRTAVLEEIARVFGCSAAHAKKLPLMVQYGASTKLIHKATKWTKEKKAPAYQEWLSGCENSEASLPKELVKYFDFLGEIKNTLGANWEGRTAASQMAMDNQIIEDKLLSMAQDFFEAKSKVVEALMFDGLMVTGDVTSMENELTVYVNNRSKEELDLDIDIQFKVKYYI